jgi:hypothetical protein
MYHSPLLSCQDMENEAREYISMESGVRLETHGAYSSLFRDAGGFALSLDSLLVALEFG